MVTSGFIKSLLSIENTLTYNVFKKQINQSSKTENITITMIILNKKDYSMFSEGLECNRFAYLLLFIGTRLFRIRTVRPIHNCIVAGAAVDPANGYQYE